MSGANLLYTFVSYIGAPLLSKSTVPRVFGFGANCFNAGNVYFCVSILLRGRRIVLFGCTPSEGIDAVPEEG
ncbi:uncharacterized protein BT62DRAFT_935140 [Guyanagaster necrorhizus]|uniref:Uncharacterized protein n=1 Tax=Guyanagaster necrorhizus TaxID=856835 RepID=A0A9P7VL81_9AGAR|nr:uncharacterized protein BT62DRAFT_935140 [Guyanagaster necrorhizus MCA 3950]KAG7443188.1 hypothetical protein BT62DRAFT_935140 [Guyanagaster necrorhizus MCA 3950]